MSEKKHWSVELRSECSRYGYGKCETRKCLIRGGYPGHGPVDNRIATCPAFEAVETWYELSMLVRWGPAGIAIDANKMAAQAPASPAQTEKAPGTNPQGLDASEL